MTKKDLECLEWGDEILQRENLQLPTRDSGNWVIVWGEGGPCEGITLFDSRTIRIHWPAGEPDYPLLLHEIAHAVKGKSGHDSEFAHIYMRLVREYFVAAVLVDGMQVAMRNGEKCYDAT